MNIPHKCPICEGKGEIGKKLAQVSSVVVSKKPLRFKCHGCYGTGMVWEFSLQPYSIPTVWQTPPFSDPPQWTTITTTDFVAKCESCSQPFISPPGAGCANPLSHLHCYNIAYPGGNTCGCPKLGPHTQECMSTWKFPPSDPNGQASS